jgi:MGT family glycosyltransferase
MNPMPANKKIMVIMFPEWAALNSTLALSRELLNKGCHVTYVGSPVFERYIADQDFMYKVFDFEGFFKKLLAINVDNFLRNRKNSKKITGRVQRFRMVVRMNEKTMTDLFRVIEELFSKDLPDLVLLDPFLWDFFPPLLRMRIPVVTLNFTLISNWNTTVPPVYSGIVPPVKLNLLSHARNLTAWSRLLFVQAVWDLWKYIVLRFCFGLSGIPSVKKSLRKQGRKLRRTELHPKLDLPEIVLCPREFDFPHAPQSKWRCYAGACVDSSRKEIPFNMGHINTGKPIVYCTLGSYSKEWKYRQLLYGAVIGAIAERPGWQLILQVAEEKDLDEFKPLPNNVFSAAWVPHMQVLPHTAIMICHGGFGTVKEALYFGIPLIVFPCDRDQPGYSARVVYHHLGVRGNIKNITDREINRLLDRVANDDLIRRSVKKMQRIFRGQEKCREGIEFIENILNKVDD